MGFWGSVKMDVLTQKATQAGLYPSSNYENCGSCQYSVHNSRSASGLSCLMFKRGLDVPASHKCDSYQWGNK